ncbi:MAG: outer membrane beta-barrel family protein [Bacteroidota bacterium]|nr:outer membrane beta-barrel family protein [Bacteroidota bacterium]
MRTTTPLLFLFLCLPGIGLKAQQLTGTAQDEQGKPLAGATITLKKGRDSSIVKLSVSNTSGKYEFIGIPQGRYFVQVSHVGYVPLSSSLFEVGGDGMTSIPKTALTKRSTELKQAEVISRKPPVEVRADKIILNVEGSINAVGQDALELLRKSPGVLVDKDDNLSLSGKNGVQVYIDGRPTPLSGKDLSEYLKTIQSSSIESIEIISNPSAKYDAAGNAGIINIRLKKNKSYGTNGTVNAGYNVGTYSKYNGGFSLNHRDENINLFGNYNYNHNPTETFIDLHREQLDTLFDQRSIIRYKTNSHNFKAGLDLTLDKKRTIGMMVTGTLSDNSLHTTSTTPISYIPTGQLSRTLQANNSSTGKRTNGDLNLNYRYADTSGREWNMDGDYSLFRIRSNQLQPNLYFDPSGTFLYSDTYNMLAPTDIDMYIFKSDYAQNFKKGRLELGAKFSNVTSRNDFTQYDIFGSGAAVKTMDTLHSNNFNYQENINAVYANFSRPFKGWVIQAGLRVENTNAHANSTGYKYDTVYSPYDSSFDRHYTNLFPSGAITYNKNPMKQWTLTYSRRIDRPAYQDLNPFEFKLDEYTFQKGNTQLKPQFTNSFGLTYMYKYKLTTTLNYSHVTDLFAQLVDTTELSKAFISKRNLATQDIVSLNVSYPIQYKRYSAFANVNSYYSLYQANFGPGRTVDVNVFAVTVYAQQSFRMGKGWTGELSGFYSSPSVYQGTFKSSMLWTLDGGLQKTVLNSKGTIKASVSDIFNTLHWRATSDFAGQSLTAKGGTESRQFKLYFSYRFGNMQVRAARQRKTAAEEEGKRVGTQGGGLSN